MNYRDFTSDNNWFSLKIPENWSEYEDEEDIFAFFNTERWSGNLRISHLRWTDVADDRDGAAFYNQSEYSNKPGAIEVKLGDWDSTFYSDETIDGKCIIYFWYTGSKNDLFICSYTFDKPFLNLDWHNNEVIVVREILSSIKILA